MKVEMATKEKAEKDQLQVRWPGRAITLLLVMICLLATVLISKEITWMMSISDHAESTDVRPVNIAIDRLEDQSLELLRQLALHRGDGQLSNSDRTELLDQFVRARKVWDSLPASIIPPDQLLNHEVDIQLGRFELLLAAWIENPSVPTDPLVAQTMRVHTSLHSFSGLLDQMQTAVHAAFVEAELRASRHALIGTVGITLLMLAITGFHYRERISKDRTIGMLDRFAHLSSQLSGQSLFEEIVRFLGDRLAVDYVLIGRLDRNHGGRVETIAVLGHGELQGNIRYDLEGTPCANLIQRDYCVYPSGVQELFPEDQLLIDMGVNAYMGTTLHDANHNPIGILVLLNADPIQSSSLNSTVVKLASARTEIELQRMQSEYEREHALEELEARVEMRTRDQQRSNEQLQEEIKIRTVLEEEQHKARQNAEDSEAAKGLFIAHASHEIRTHINGLLGMLSLIEEREYSTEDRERISTALASGDALLTLINDLLDYSKVESGQLQIDQVDFDLKVLLQDVSGLFTARTHKKGLLLEMDITPDTPFELRGDPGRLRQILSNLVDNASKFTSEGRIVVRATPAQLPDHLLAVQIEVIDTGIGIGDAEVKKLFRPFTQADQSISRRFGGTGLGLAISAQLCELMGGHLSVESKLGEGTRFCLTLPFEQANKPVRTRSGKLAGKPFEQLRILIVDDSSVSRAYLSSLLEAWHIDYSEVTSGEQAIAALDAAQTPYDVVIMDRMMPEMDGIELATRIRDQAGSDCPALIMVSRFGGPPTSDEALRAGLARCLNKPVSQSELFDALVDTLNVQQPRKPVSDVGDPASWRLLVAEDNEVNQRVAQGMLEKLGYQADVVGNGQLAIEALQRQPYNLVLMDCQMPELDGYAATKCIRQLNGAARHTPIVAMTAHALGNERERCLDAGMDDYLAKPVRIDQLRNTVEYWCGMRTDSPEAGAATESAQESSAEILDQQLDVAVLDTLREVMGTQLLPLIDIYLADTRTRLESMHADLKRNDREAIAHTAHTIKGSSRNVGATRIGTLSSALYDLAREDASWDQLASKIASLDAAYGALCPLILDYRSSHEESGAAAVS